MGKTYFTRMQEQAGFNWVNAQLPVNNKINNQSKGMGH